MSGWYWTFPDNQLPTLGSGLRRLHMKAGGDDYTVTLTDAAGVAETSIRLDVWESIPHVEDNNQPLSEVLAALRGAEVREVRQQKEKRRATVSHTQSSDVPGA